MSLVRRAEPEDAEEVLRLRQVMIDSMFAADTSTDWHAESLPTLRARLAEPDGGFVAFVVDHPERPGALAALVAGTIDYRIGRAGNPRGIVGYVFSVATDPGTAGAGTRARAWIRCWSGSVSAVPTASSSPRRRRPRRCTPPSASCPSPTRCWS